MVREKIVLFDGKNLDNWHALEGGGPAKWIIGDDGAMTVVPRSGDIVSNEIFSDAHIHVEFWLPYMPEEKGQGRANSGVYVHGCYEIQILDSYEVDVAADNDCGGIYSMYKPLCNACLAPETWQTYDIYIHSPKFDENGNVTEDSFITIFLNGVCIHNNTKLYRHTPGGVTEYRVPQGPLLLQDHHDEVRFRNIWIEKLDRDSDK